MSAADYDVAFVVAHAWGFCAGVTLPRVRGRGADDAVAVPDAVVAGLRDAERAHARTLAPVRAVSWVGGRLALRAALDALARSGVGFDGGAPILPDDKGAPVLPASVAGSISHKDGLAVALAGPRGSLGVCLGVDVEELRPGRADIAARILGPREEADLATVDGPARAAEVLRRFAFKEAIYKALAPTLRRYIGFREVEVIRDEQTVWRASFTPSAGEPAMTVDVDTLDVAGAGVGHILVAARCFPDAER